jgi:transposase InsO family protein
MSNSSQFEARIKGRRPVLTKHARWREAARALKLSRQARLRLDWIIYYNQKQSAALTMRHFGLSGKVFYFWLNRFDELDLTSLEDRSRRPRSLRTKQYTALEVSRMQQLHRDHPTLGREKLRVLYAEQYGTEISSWHARCIIHDFQLFAVRAVRSFWRRVRTKGEPKRRLTELEQKPFVGYVVEVDAVVLYLAGLKRYIFTAVDYHSRLAYARMYKSKSSANAADFLRRLVLLLDGQISNIHIDNGSEFAGNFAAAARDLKLGLFHARPYTPKDKPLVERFNGILQQEFVNLGNLHDDPEVFNPDLTEWLIYYNFVRPHHALGLKRPAEFANMKAARVLPMYSPITWHCQDCSVRV